MKSHSIHIGFICLIALSCQISAQEMKTDEVKKEVAKQKSLFQTAPYLQNARTDSMTVAWSTIKPCYSWVEYGDSEELGNKAHTIVDGQIVANNRLNKIVVTGLESGKTYHYKVCSKDILEFGAYKVKWGRVEESKTFTFTTVENGAEKFTCAIFNDLHDNHKLYRALAAQLEKCDYDLSIFNGDCFNDPRSEDQVVRSLNVFNRGVRSSETPVIYLRGNHEIRGSYSRQWSKHFSTPDSKQYYAITRGPIRMIFLDCGEDKVDTNRAYSGLNDFSGFRKEQADWLEKEIKSDEYQNAAFRVLIHHIPIFDLKDSRTVLWNLWKPIVNNAGIDMTIHGHTHRPAVHDFTIENKEMKRIVLGDWFEQGSVLECDEKGCRLESIS